VKRLGAVSAVVREQKLRDFASLLLEKGLGLRTLQSLALIAVVVQPFPRSARLGSMEKAEAFGSDRLTHKVEREPEPLANFDVTIQTNG
jgi:hypothetical protein